MRLNIRIAFCKQDKARFISHLDTMHVFQQALARAELPVYYTEGFNPHAYVSVLLPLPVGMESLCERLDFGLTESINLGSLPEKLNKALPEGLRVTGAMAAVRPVSQLAFARYRIIVDSAVTPEQAEGLLNKPCIVDKRTKKKDYVPTDISPMTRDISCTRVSGGLEFYVTVCAQNPTLNPEYIADAWRLYLDPEAAFTFSRIALFGADGEKFDEI